jgi:hypothetical protein
MTVIARIEEALGGSWRYDRSKRCWVEVVPPHLQDREARCYVVREKDGLTLYDPNISEDPIGKL